MSNRTELEEFLIEKVGHLEVELKATREEMTELECNLIYYRQFYHWAKNRLEEEGILLTENGVKKPHEMTKNELIARNELAVRKQESKVSEIPPNLPKQPDYKELYEKYTEENKYTKQLFESNPRLKEFFDLIKCPVEINLINPKEFTGEVLGKE